MRILAHKKISIQVFFICIFPIYIHGQNAKNNYKNENKFEQLLVEKRKTNLTNALNERYKIQIFSGDSERAKKIINAFKEENKSIESTIVFNTPNYKVWVGPFNTKMEAEKNFAEIKKKYKNAFIIKPVK